MMNDIELIITCSCCGVKQDALQWNEDTALEMSTRNYCWDCNYWYKFLNDVVPDEYHHSIHTAVVINGEVFTDGGNKGPEYRGMMGHAGRKFTIRMLDGGKEWTTNNLWAGGKIPVTWRDNIPDTAEFVK